MPTRKALIQKLTSERIPRNYTVRELDILMSKCDCEKYQGGRGSGIGYKPVKELYVYQVKAVIAFLRMIGEI